MSFRHPLVNGVCWYEQPDAVGLKKNLSLFLKNKYERLCSLEHSVLSCYWVFHLGKRQPSCSHKNDLGTEPDRYRTEDLHRKDTRWMDTEPAFLVTQTSLIQYFSLLKPTSFQLTGPHLSTVIHGHCFHVWNISWMCRSSKNVNTTAFVHSPICPCTPGMQGLAALAGQHIRATWDSGRLQHRPSKTTYWAVFLHQAVGFGKKETVHFLTFKRASLGQGVGRGVDVGDGSGRWTFGYCTCKYIWCTHGQHSIPIWSHLKVEPLCVWISYHTETRADVFSQISLMTNNLAFWIRRKERHEKRNSLPLYH